MDNPNPIKYSDLVAPDNSITNLIAQLNELIGAYDAAKAKIQSAAADAAKSMQALSGATDEQRQRIATLATESEKLARAYEKTDVAEREVYRRRQEVIQAVKEEQRIDKLVVELNNAKEGSYNRLSAQYRLNKIRLNEMSAAERQGTEAGRKLEQETRQIYEEMSRLQKTTGKYTLEVGHYENALKGLPGPIGRVVSGLSRTQEQLKGIAQSSAPSASKALQGLAVVGLGVVGMLLALAKAFTSVVKKNAEFEQANANLSTILGVSREEMKALTNSALMLGRTTEYTASQVTELQTALAKLGFGKGSIIAMQQYVLQFATAVGANLGDAAEVAGSALRAFGLTSADTEDTLATLAVATNKSALNFERIKQSIGTVFPVANAFGLTIKDATALLGALANAGFDASTAATAARNILLNLANANGKLAKSLGGPAKSFEEIIDGLIKLRDAGTNLNEALELTDKRSVAAFSSLLSGAESARELRTALEDVDGELERIQSERLNTVEGSTKLLKSAWEGLTLAFQKSNGAIKQLIDNLTLLVGATTQFLFPKEAAVQRAAETFTEYLRGEYKKSGAEAAKALMQELEQRYSLAVQVTGGKGRAGKQAVADLEGVRQAIDTITSQIENDAAEAVRQAQAQADKARDAAQKADDDAKKAEKQRIADLRAVVEAINLEIAVTEAGTDQMLQKRLDKVEAERQLELEQNRQKVESERQDEAAINAKYDREAIKVREQFNADVSKLAVQRLQAEQQAIQLEIAITDDGTQEMLALRLANIQKQREIEIEQNKQKAEDVRQSEAAINAKYDTMVLRETAKFNTQLAQRNLKASQDLAQAEFDLLDRNERQKTLFRLQQEKVRLETILKINETATEKMTEDEINAIKKTIEGIKKEADRLGYDNLYELLGISLDSDQQSALNTAIDSVKDSIGSLVDSWKSVADAAKEAADEQVDAAQKALDAEIEARNAGYAHSVELAQKELDLAKKNAAKAEREQVKAQKAQLAIDTVTQTSSLVTASANIWKSLSGIPEVGPALAVAALTTMWGSFAAAKIKAAEVAGVKTEKYGEGVVELLQGGSHASGHDIDLGRKSDGTRRRAEGGEFFAVINKRNSRRYRHIIPDVINSFNNGTFTDRYQRANAAMAGIALSMGAGVDVTGIERDVHEIRRQGEESRSVDNAGNIIIRYKNLTRKIKS